MITRSMAKENQRRAATNADSTTSEKELEAQIAALSSRDSHSSRRSTIDKWLDAAIVNPLNNQNSNEASHTLIQECSNLPVSQAGNTTSYSAAPEVRTASSEVLSPFVSDLSRPCAVQADMNSLGQPSELLSMQSLIKPAPLSKSEHHGPPYAAPNFNLAASHARSPYHIQAHTYSEFEDHQPPLRAPSKERHGTIDSLPTVINVPKSVCFSCSLAQEPAPLRPEVAYSQRPYSCTARAAGVIDRAPVLPQWRYWRTCTSED
ncbi:hypothetical protein ACJJTC_012987 [Scirpophaga incertulas]